MKDIMSNSIIASRPGPGLLQSCEDDRNPFVMDGAGVFTRAEVVLITWRFKNSFSSFKSRILDLDSRIFSIVCLLGLT